MSDQKVATSVVDKNGKHTTVHKNPIPKPSGSRSYGISIPPVIPHSDGVYEDQMELVSIAADARRSLGSAASSFEFEVNDRGGLTINSVRDADGNKLWDLHSPTDGVSTDVSVMEVNLLHVGFERSLDAGLIDSDGMGSFFVDFDTVESLR